jgi:hypothetical protein
MCELDFRKFCLYFWGEIEIENRLSNIALILIHHDTDEVVNCRFLTYLTIDENSRDSLSTQFYNYIDKKNIDINRDNPFSIDEYIELGSKEEIKQYITQLLNGYIKDIA